MAQIVQQSVSKVTIEFERNRGAASDDMHCATAFCIHTSAADDGVRHELIPSIDERAELLLDAGGPLLHGINGVRQSHDPVARHPPGFESFDMSTYR